METKTTTESPVYVIEIKEGRRVGANKTMREVYSGPTRSGGAKFTTQFHSHEWAKFNTYEEAAYALGLVIKQSGLSVDSLTITEE